MKKFFLLILLLPALIFALGSCSKQAPVKTAADEKAAPAEDTGFKQEGTEAGKALPAGTALDLPRVYFEFDKATLTAEGREIVKKNAAALQANAKAKVVVEGHCDERGSTEYNMALGERRAQSIKAYLLQLGVTPNRVSTISYGEERPLDPAHSEAAWAKNRRGEFVVSQ